MLKNRGKKSIPEVLPEIHKKYPKLKKRLTKQRAYALDGYYKTNKKKRKKKAGMKGKPGRKKNGVAQFINVAAARKKAILTAGLVLKEQGKTPNSIRDTLAENFEKVMLPPAKQLSKMIVAFAKDGEIPNSPNGKPAKSKLPYVISVKGPGVNVGSKRATDAVGEKVLQLLFGGG
jgi:hypothetical protein